MAAEVRKLTIDDYDDIIRVWADAGLPYRPEGRDRRELIDVEMKRPDTAFFGLFEDGRMLAVGLATHDGRKGWVNRVAVDPYERGRGLGGEIIAACEAFLKEHGAEVIGCLIEDINYPSITLFQKHGYSVYEGILYFSKRESPES